MLVTFTFKKAGTIGSFPVPAALLLKRLGGTKEVLCVRKQRPSVLSRPKHAGKVTKAYVR